ncbi:hypothetical protein C8J57DRAFT_1538262 [Mycena rebaudengoi]|nr:hypothetical protein C8J57DRAFT_1538262 [Mycena rebaudengoi]
MESDVYYAKRAILCASYFVFPLLFHLPHDLLSPSTLLYIAPFSSCSHPFLLSCLFYHILSSPRSYVLTTVTILSLRLVFRPCHSILSLPFCSFLLPSVSSSLLPFSSSSPRVVRMAPCSVYASLFVRWAPGGQARRRVRNRPRADVCAALPARAVCHPMRDVAHAQTRALSWGYGRAADGITRVSHFPPFRYSRPPRNGHPKPPPIPTLLPHTVFVFVHPPHSSSIPSPISVTAPATPPRDTLPARLLLPTSPPTSHAHATHIPYAPPTPPRHPSSSSSPSAPSSPALTISPPAHLLPPLIVTPSPLPLHPSFPRTPPRTHPPHPPPASRSRRDALRRRLRALHTQHPHALDTPALLAFLRAHPALECVALVRDEGVPARSKCPSLGH